tara:strand:+ start:257 stop:778 length:522 start_codon:yes stop_codon:yes gene_type:complete
MSLKKFYYKKIRSTNDMALKHIAKGVEKGIIITDFQTKGKGQRGKVWISLNGNLFMSVFFQIKRKLNLKKITKTNCKNVRDCLQKFTNYKIVVKQPNDLFINNQKICGILQETIFKKNKKFLVVGIGININKSPKIKNYPTNFINFFTAKKVKKFELFKKLSNVFEKKVIQFN